MRKKLFQTATAVLALTMLLAAPGCKKQETTADVSPTITAELTKEPEATPEPTAEPTKEPTAEPTKEPAAEPTKEPTAEPTDAPTPEPTIEPTGSVVQGEHVRVAEKLSEKDHATVVSTTETLLSSVASIEGEEITAKPLFWKVTDPDGEGVLYLLGSFHITDSRAYQVHPEIKKAYEASDAVALEFDLLPYVSIQSKALEMYSAYVDTSLKTVDKVIGKELYEKAKAFLTEYNSYVAGLEYYKPYYWDSLMTNIVYQMAGIGDVIGYDLYFDSLAYRDGKTILEFESMEAQNELLLSADNRMYINDIESVLDEESRKEMIEEAGKLYEGWLSGDEEALIELVNPDYSDPEFLALEEDFQENLKAYNKAMYEERNNGMAAGMKECIENGTVTLCIVGTAHFLGETGAVNQLKKAGYIVEQIVLE